MKSVCIILALLFFSAPAYSQDIIVGGTLEKWHPVTLTINGPEAAEEGDPNPFLDYRLEVTFTQGNTSVVVPGYFAADGNAAETGATSGSTWRVHFVPRSEGEWQYAVSMRTGSDVAVDDAPGAGTPTPQDGLTGSFVVSANTDAQNKGMLTYNGTHFLQFDSGDYFIKGGADSPENFLGYYEFDNTEDFGCQNNTLQNGLHRYEAHESDWQAGDPVWHTNKGKGIIGALNYLASKNINSVYFLTMNTEGDGCEVYPWTAYGDAAAERIRYDVSKLDQWNIVLDHMDKLGLMLHIVTQETENDQLLDGGALGTERKLYYRELVARFGYHRAITWNLGEENTNSHQQRVAFAEYLSALEPYGQNIVLHTFPGQIGGIYDDLLGYPNENPITAYTGNSIQRDLENDIHGQVLKWLERSAEMNHPWVVTLDEIGPAGIGAKPDGSGNNHKTIREEALWATLMAGGAGVEWYFGYNNPHDDLDMEDWRSRDALWDYTAHAVGFFQDYLPFTEMVSADDLIPGNNDYVFARHGDTYAVYLFDPESANAISLPAGTYEVQWYDPRAGTFHAGTQLSGAGPHDLGLPPQDTGEDWALLITAGELSVRPPDTPVNTAPGLQYAYYEGTWQTMPDFAPLEPVKTGFTANIDLSERERENEFGFLFTGFIDAPADGVYTFYTSSDDGSQMYIGDQLVVNNDGVHADAEQQGSIALAAGLHEITFLYFENAGQESFTVAWTPPGGTKTAIADADFLYDTDDLLPVELTSFDGLISNGAVHLLWETASELNNAGFFIERSAERNSGYEEIAFIDGAGTSTAVQTYLYVDNGPFQAGTPVFYRLKQVDFDGTVHYSSAIELTPGLIDSLTLNQNFPNPFNPTTHISFSLPFQDRVTLSVYDATGRLVETLIDGSLPAGSHDIVFEASASLASGTYMYKLETTRQTKTGMMLLLK